MNKLYFLLFLYVSIVSCSNNEESEKVVALDKAKFEEYAVKSFQESEKTGTAKARNIRVDTVLVISSRTAERIKAKAFERDYEFQCKIDSLPYSKELEKDSVRNWLERAKKLPNTDTVGYRVKFKLDYLMDGKLSPDTWIKSFDKKYRSFDELDGPLLEEEYFLLDDLNE